MRLKSRSLSLNAEDYTTDAVELFDNVYNPANFIEQVSGSEINLIQENGGARIYQLQSIKDSLNENFILRMERTILLLWILSRKSSSN